MIFDSFTIAEKLDIEHESLKRMVKKYGIKCSEENETIVKKVGRPEIKLKFNFEEFKVLLALLNNSDKTVSLKMLLCDDVKLLEEYNKMKSVRTKGYVYFLETNGRTKIGITKRLEKRIRALTHHIGLKETDFSCEVLESFNYTEIEKEFHGIFKNKRIQGEWFDLSIEEIKESCYYKEISGGV